MTVCGKQRPKREIFTLHYKATRGLLATDLGILNHGQVKRTTLELAIPSPTFYTTPTGGRLGLDIFCAHRPPQHGGSSAVLDSNSWHACHKSDTLTSRLP
ncbi:hypothetical protein TNCV_5098691 [Trichonephila clavipes]|uniref:Uncharacterized protein n=1 Tax=Trichonephila clavipes TaxID=2585209 RepID=A0A8X6RZE7_TRICX|nr:hypothetical protein TNCV_5098691 [Trichonephila clavipes]